MEGSLGDGNQSEIGPDKERQQNALLGGNGFIRSLLDKLG